MAFVSDAFIEAVQADSGGCSSCLRQDCRTDDHEEHVRGISRPRRMTSLSSVLVSIDSEAPGGSRAVPFTDNSYSPSEEVLHFEPKNFIDELEIKVRAGGVRLVIGALADCFGW